MLIIISPAKILDLKPQQVVSTYTLPDFLTKAKTLIQILRQFTPADLSELSGTNTAIGKLNYDRYYNWQTPFTAENAKQAILLFNGEVYNGLKAKTLLHEDFEYMQNHLRILSGLYGVLRPLDLMQPYRLEMGCKLETAKGKTLYEYWGNNITNTLNKALEESGKPQLLVNLASAEYFKSINTRLLKAPIVHIEFLENKNDSYRPIVVYTKKARGMMARFIIQNRIEQKEDLKGFSEDGYWFSPLLSTEDKFVFTRG